MKDSRARIRIQVPPPSDEATGNDSAFGKPLSAQEQDAPALYVVSPSVNAQSGSSPRTRRGQFRSSHRRLPPGTLIACTGLLLLALVIPVVLVWPHRTHPQPVPSVHVQPHTTPRSDVADGTKGLPTKTVQVRVFLSTRGTIETLPLEDYVTGVVAAEMPPEFSHEALKAQAIAARTFIIRRLLSKDSSGAPAGADVVDTVEHQAYLPLSVLRQQAQNPRRAAKLNEVRKAVKDTEDTIMTYQGEPITAVFFSTSNGYTENSEDVWKTHIPYLRSVPSPWDKKIAPGYKKTITLKTTNMLDKLGLNGEAVKTVAGAGAFPGMKVLSTTEGHRIKRIRIGDTIFKGTDLRHKLGLRSSEFTWAIHGKEIVITTYGNGHGVGMSQWGANGMAQAGYTATQILKHYYTGISFTKASKLL